MECPKRIIECKAYYAIIVKEITPYGSFVEYWEMTPNGRKEAFSGNYLRLFLLDSFPASGIIRLTGTMSYLGDRYHGRLRRCKNGSTRSKWHIEQPSGGCYRRPILGERIFRPSGHGTSQVRDASAGAARWSGSFKGIQNVWFFSCYILPDPAGLRPAGTSWPNAATARPKACSQVNRRCDGVYFGLQKQKSISSGNGFGNQDKTAFRVKRPSPQYRTSTAASAKKRAVDLSEPDECFDQCCRRYEQLRQMTLEMRDYHCHGWGLALLIHRGLAAWVHAFSKIESSQQQFVPVTPVSDKACLAIPDTIRGRMIMTISEMVLSTLQGVAS